MIRSLRCFGYAVNELHGRGEIPELICSREDLAPP